jgi:hypothetical protein
MARTTAVTLTRRSYLQGSALCALYVCAARAAGAATFSSTGLSIDAIVVEAGLPQASQLVKEAASRGRVELLRDDVADLFYGRLVPQWRSHGVRGLVGLTRAPAVYLLEPLVADYGLRTIALERTTMGAAAALDTLCVADEKQRPTVGRERLRNALIERDDSLFVWRMAPRSRPVHADISVLTS